MLKRLLESILTWLVIALWLAVELYRELRSKLSRPFRRFLR
jgi:hypothetical protein